MHRLLEIDGVAGAVGRRQHGSIRVDLREGPGGAVRTRVEADRDLAGPAEAEDALAPSERALWSGMRAIPARRREWLLGRFAAKIAVRALVAPEHAFEPSLIDIAILPDDHGCPRAAGAWAGLIGGRAPLVSIAHSGGAAVALACSAERFAGAGIDIERPRPFSADLERAAFADGERRLAAVLGEAWRLRLWCAKEAAAKALGRGLMGSPLFLVAHSADTEGNVALSLAGALAREFPDRAGATIGARTFLDGADVVATALLPRLAG